MTHLQGKERARYVQEMFGQIAPRYDLMNRLMTFAQDVNWRRQVIQRASLQPGSRLLDLGTGTGDLAGEALRQQPDCLVVAADFTLPMMIMGQGRFAQPAPDWSAADAERLPFPDQTFDAVVSGFLLRNVTDLTQSLREQYRVLKIGGRIVALDTTPPQEDLLKPLVQFHLGTVIPALGKLVTGQAEAYRYLPETTQNFLEPERLAGRLISAGFYHVGYVRLMFGTIAIYWGTK